jgi:hypothetical protein
VNPVTSAGFGDADPPAGRALVLVQAEDRFALFHLASGTPANR